MELKAALELALAILEPFKESSLYDDYRSEGPSGPDWSDEEYDAMLERLRKLKGIL